MRIRRFLLASVAVVFVLAGCRHKCQKLFDRDSCCPPLGGTGPRSPLLLPPTQVPTTPSSPAPAPFPPPALMPETSNFPPPAALPPKAHGPDVLLPDPLPGGMSLRPGPAGTNVLGSPVKPSTPEPTKATTGLPGYTKVKDGIFAGGKPTLDGFDTLKQAGFRTVIYLHGPGADTNAVKDMAATRHLTGFTIATTPETLAEASQQFQRLTTDKVNHPVYVFSDDPRRAGAVWYLYFRTVDAYGDDVARLRAKSLGLSEQGEEGQAFALAIQRILETK
ncbi:MAG: hypothetical protein RMJ56_02800 [Gemmataceae bacterium]|nr:hypothetical protein [Gemmata sp.]MDW8196516.1 hypothetical protein [Gemmataceae bacterium]